MSKYCPICNAITNCTDNCNQCMNEEEKEMKLYYGMSKEEWKKVLDALKNTDGVTITSYAKTDNNELFVDFKYIIFEYNEYFFYVQEELLVYGGVNVTPYKKVSPYEKQQCDYPHKISTFEELIEYAKGFSALRPLKDTYKQRIFDVYTIHNGCTDLYNLANNLAGWREKHVLGNLKSISMKQNTEDYQVLRFIANDGETFDYETKSRRITG